LTKAHFGVILGKMSTGTLAPPFTRENAADFARKGHAIRAARKNQFSPVTDDAMQIENIKRQIARVLRWMERAKDKDEHSKLAGTLDKLWSKAYPTQAAQRSKPKAGQSQAQPLPSDPIQEPTQAQEL
jgi:hypothetical protein